MEDKQNKWEKEHICCVIVEKQAILVDHVETKQA